MKKCRENYKRKEQGKGNSIKFSHRGQSTNGFITYRSRKKTKQRTTHTESSTEEEESLRSSQWLFYSFLWSYFPPAWPPTARFNFLIGEIWFSEWWMSLLWLHRITMFEEESETDGAEKPRSLKSRRGWSRNISGFTWESSLASSDLSEGGGFSALSYIRHRWSCSYVIL